MLVLTKKLIKIFKTKKLALKGFLALNAWESSPKIAWKNMLKFVRRYQPIPNLKKFHLFQKNKLRTLKLNFRNKHFKMSIYKSVRSVEEILLVREFKNTNKFAKESIKKRYHLLLLIPLRSKNLFKKFRSAHKT